MLLFQAEHIIPILEGRKTQTRRFWSKARVTVGSYQKLYSGGLPCSPCQNCGGTGGDTGIAEEDLSSMGCYKCEGTGRLQPFASVRILRVWQQQVRDMSPDEITAEGYPGWHHIEFAQKLIEVNKFKLSVAAVLHLRPYVIEFEVVKP